MDDVKGPREPDGKRSRPLARGLKWVYEQVLLKDGGVVTTLRGVLAAALFTCLARFYPSLSDLSLASVLAALVVVATVTGILVVRRVRRANKVAPVQARPADEAVSIAAEEASPAKRAGSFKGVVVWVSEDRVEVVVHREGKPEGEP